MAYVLENKLGRLPGDIKNNILKVRLSQDKFVFSQKNTRNLMSDAFYLR